MNTLPPSAQEFLFSAAVVLFVFLLVVLILWFFLPFAVFGIKRRLDRMIEMNKQSSQTLDQIGELLAEQKKLDEIRNKSLRSNSQNSTKPPRE